MTTNTNYSEYYAPIFAGMGAITPTYWGFECKSALQLEKPIPYTTVSKALKKGMKASPSIGFTVGIQVIAQKGIEKWIQKGGAQPSFAETFMSSTIVALISGPSLAGFNGMTAGKGFFKSIKELKPKQMGALVTRETSFLFSLGISAPLTQTIKHYCGDNIYIENISLFMTGVLGSLAGHPGDTALTLWQNGGEITGVKRLMYGAAAKSVTVGIFFVLYKNIEKQLR